MLSVRTEAAVLAPKHATQAACAGSQLGGRREQKTTLTCSSAAKFTGLNYVDAL